MTSVLVVEDEAEVRLVIEMALEDAGLSFASAPTDTSAYDLLEREGRGFSVLVTDINLGSATTGFDVARRARQLNPGIKVIYITGHGAAPMGRFGVEGAELLPKPFSPFELAARVRQRVH